MNAQPAFRHGLDEPGPIQISAGRWQIRGWCAAAPAAHPPAVRIVCAGHVIPAETRPASDGDAPPAGDLQPPAAAGRFAATVVLQPGLHELGLEASLDGSTWYPLRRFHAVVLPRRLQGAVEVPATGAIPSGPQIRGWCAHPDLRIVELWLRYGNRHVACRYGLPHGDASTGSAAVGFASPDELPTGRGPLRLRARDDRGWLHIMDTGHAVATAGADACPDPAAEPPRLAPRLPPAPTPAARAAARPLRILFALYGDMTSNSTLHVAALANELADRGHECILALPHGADRADIHRVRRFRSVGYADCGARADLFAGRATPDIIHAWTTAERVRRFATSVAFASAARLVVHLEDNEGSILAAELGRSESALAELPPEELDQLVGEDRSHPLRRAEFLRRADGCTIIVDRLAELLPAGKPSRLIQPGVAPEFFPRPRPVALREALGWGASHTVLLYHGNLHATNRADMAELYEAIVALNASGLPTTLIRIGRDFCSLPGDLAQRAAPWVVELGHIVRHDHIAPLLALADVFVQPGSPDSFNNYRYPSKLPEFFASGRPVVLPRTNLGLVARDGIDAIVLDRVDAPGIVAAVRRLRAEPGLAARLGEAAAAFARGHFDWSRSAEELGAFYAGLLAASPAPQSASPRG